MITEALYIAYFQNLATQHKGLLHGTNGDAFFYIPLSYDLTEIDNAIRNTKKSPLLALDALKGRFDDSQSESHVQYIDGQFMILAKAAKGDAASIRAVQDTCLSIGLQVITRMQNDSKKNPLLADNGSRANFVIRNVSYQTCGPIELLHYGYTFSFVFTCPFGFAINNAIWLDK